MTRLQGIERGCEKSQHWQLNWATVPTADLATLLAVAKAAKKFQDTGEMGGDEWHKDAEALADALAELEKETA